MRGLVGRLTRCVAFPLCASARPPSRKTQSDNPRVRAEPGAPKAQKHIIQQPRMYCTTTAVTVLNSSGRDARSVAEYSHDKATAEGFVKYGGSFTFCYLNSIFENVNFGISVDVFSVMISSCSRRYGMRFTAFSNFGPRMISLICIGPGGRTNSIGGTPGVYYSPKSPFARSFKATVTAK